MTLDLQQLARDVRGFSGEFKFEPEHTIDRGIGHIADFADVYDRLVFVPHKRMSDDDVCVITNQVEPHIAEAIARMLNAVGPLVEEVERLRDHLRVSEEQYDVLGDANVLSVQLAAMTAARDRLYDIAKGTFDRLLMTKEIADECDQLRKAGFK